MSVAEHSFLDETWLTPLEIAHVFGYSTDKPIRKAIMRGELKATRAPCGRKLLVSESEVRRWIDAALAFEPAVAASPPVTTAPTNKSPRRRPRMPRLQYESSSRRSS
jgi:excisionase family DNA binding protein